MVMDILLVVIFGFAVFFCMHRGFVMTVVGCLRSIAALVLGFLFCDDLRDFILSRTGLMDWLTGKVETAVSTALTEAFQDTALYAALPRLLREEATALTGSLAAEGLSSIAMIFLNLLSFLLIVLGVNLVAGILRHLLSKQYRGGFLGFVDWLLGGILGIVSGLICVSIFLAVVTPLTALLFPDLSDSLAASMEASRLAGPLYDNNPLLLLLGFFLRD